MYSETALAAKRSGRSFCIRVDSQKSERETFSVKGEILVTHKRSLCRVTKALGETSKMYLATGNCTDVY